MDSSAMLELSPYSKVQAQTTGLDSSDAVFLPFNQQPSKSFISFRSVSSVSSNGIIGSGRPRTPSRAGISRISASSESPLRDNDGLDAIPSTLLDSPQTENKQNRIAAESKYKFGGSSVSSFGLQRVPENSSLAAAHVQDRRSFDHEPSISMNLQGAIVSSACDYETATRHQLSKRSVSSSESFNQPQSDSSLFYNEPQRYDLSASFEALSVLSSSSSARSWRAHIQDNKSLGNHEFRSSSLLGKDYVRFTESIADDGRIQPSRYLKISGLSKTADANLISEKFHGFGDLRGVYAREIGLNGSIILGYFDLRHAVTAYKTICSQPIMGYNLRPQFFPKSYLAQMYESGIDIPFISNNEGELYIYFSSGSAKMARGILEKYLPPFGSIQSLKIENEALIVCEFFDVRDSASAVLTLNGKVIDGVIFYVSFKDNGFPNIDSLAPGESSPHNSLSQTFGPTGFENWLPRLSPETPAFGKKRGGPLSTMNTNMVAERNRPHGVTTGSESPFDQSLYGDGFLVHGQVQEYGNQPTTLDKAEYFARLNRRHSTSIPRSPGSDSQWDAEASLTFQLETIADLSSRNYNVYTNATVPKNNVVDLEKIARGLDTRTTLMLRNIPNKVDQQMLKEYIDVTNKNTYDFLYLRIDFLNKCNVGYAFISFTSPEAIITFAKARAGTKWNRFNSEKICDISYANIQGKECLIEKFRNSSVMDQDAAYRPKIYYSDGPLKGHEEEFPPPNNMNRKLRSLASIQQIGLFPPGSNSASWRRIARY
ncbi:RNA recognition motif 2-domain-containing protein [Lipomyces japonicus]|uniref:RNA recognition motif 2-domain-containing protein n=1 Tax=Lipomyces japonicus TaxID=56871 RepID=UPI0034CF6A54